MAQSAPEQPGFVPYRVERVAPEEGLRRVRAFRALMETRRSVRSFSPEPVPRETIEEILRAATSGPSGANKQPWSFVAISDPATKRRVREAAEAQERRLYEGIVPQDMLADIAGLGVGPEKRHLTDAPWIIVVFAQDKGLRPDGTAFKHYYVNESVGIAAGLLLAAVRSAGLVALTHTPSPMNFLRELLGRPRNERGFLVIPVGYPAPDAVVPVLGRKPLDGTVTWLG